SSPATATPLARGQVLIVLPAGLVWYPDYERVRTALQHAGLDVRVASSRPTSVPTLAAIDQPGPEIVPDLLLSDARIDQFQGIVLIGYEIDEFLPGKRHADLMRRVVDQAVRGGATVGSICAANAILSRHGYLAGRPAAASQWAVQAGAQDGEADWRASSVQCSGPFVTASSDAQAAEFARLLVQQMSAAEQ
ncbi:MAG: DJ-1/PfpI family protein, partial [Pirellulaceae bacterium]|nr:DJ-1/PfpI family protein [Pirellulaceae bacterium]